MPPRSLIAYVTVLATLVLAVVLAPYATSPAHANASQTALVSAAAPSCTGYSTPRWFIEGQGWWRDLGEDFFAQEHMHLGACVPHGQTIRGVLPLDLTIKLHNNRSAIYFVSAGINQRGVQNTRGCYGAVACEMFNPPLTCSAGDCTFNVRLNLPTTAAAYDGQTELNVHVNAKQPDGDETRTGFAWQSDLDNGKPMGSVAKFETVRGLVWQTATEYQMPLIGTLPTTPVSGAWPLILQTRDQGTPITEYELLIDPDVHAGSRGTVVAAGLGPFKGNATIDTTKLANGPHKLAFRAGSRVLRGTSSGVIVIPFTVQN